jgi:hypothetical protein
MSLDGANDPGLPRPKLILHVGGAQEAATRLKVGKTALYEALRVP